MPFSNEFHPVTFVLLVAVTLALITAMGIWLFRPLVVAAKRANLPPNFTMVDMLSLVFLVQLPMAINHGYIAPYTNDVGTWAVDGYGWLAAGVLWWATVRTMSRAGIRSAWQRTTFIAIVLPLALACQICVSLLIWLPAIGSHVRDFQASVPSTATLVSMAIFSAVATYVGGRYTRYAVAGIELNASDETIAVEPSGTSSE